MARKRLIENPPPAASSSDEEGEDESSSEEEEEEAAQGNIIKTQQNSALKEQNGTGDSGEDEEEDEEGDEDDDDDDDEDEQKVKRNQTAVATKSDSDSTDTESSLPPSPSVSDFTIKPISPKTKPKPVPKSESKKEMEVVRNDKKPAKRGPSSGTGSSRLWSDDDEIVILNGMIEYQTQKGKNPLSDCNDFHEFLKESLHVDASNNQFADKLRRLKKKYYTDVEKKENGKDEIFAKQHDLDCVELAKKIWGTGGIGSAKSKKGGRDGGSGGGAAAAASGGITLALAKGDVNGEKRELNKKKQKRVSNEEANGEGKEGNLKKKKRSSNEDVDEEGKEVNVKKQKCVLIEEVSAEKQKRVVNEVNGGGGKLVVNNKVVPIKEVDGREERNEDLSDKYPCLLSSFESLDLTGGAKERAIVMLGMVEEEKLKELEREWRTLMLVKLEVAAKEKVLVGKQIKLVLDASKSQD